ncbi:hypothetical protein [Plantactinospora sp. WMMB782]|uniref:hypothetical protein n=1 Tax=Plantactinospora sp. WMMB782 TaxID=3404121 RepID=UPI003B92372C
MLPQVVDAVARWRGRGPSRPTRVCWSLALLAGYAAWSWAVHDWAVDHGHDGLVEGWRPWYLAIAGLTYWPPACLLWWALFRSGGFAPWQRSGSV